MTIIEEDHIYDPLFFENIPYYIGIYPKTQRIFYLIKNEKRVDFRDMFCYNKHIS